MDNAIHEVACKPFSYPEGTIRNCHFGTPWEKPTTVLVFGNPWFKQHEIVCTSVVIDVICIRSQGKHFPLEGIADSIADCFKRTKTFRTAIAKSYHTKRCKLWIQLTSDCKGIKHDDSTTHNCFVTNTNAAACLNRRGDELLESPLQRQYRNCAGKFGLGDEPPADRYLTHYPKHPGCETCIRTNTVRTKTP